eukprot:1157802-Pelagomonas_calceolata.AAC.7
MVPEWEAGHDPWEAGHDLSGKLVMFLKLEAGHYPWKLAMIPERVAGYVLGPPWQGNDLN